MRILVTGAAGLIGTVLRRGLGDDHDVTGIDRTAGLDGVATVDSTRLDELEQTMDGVDAVVDLASLPAVDLPWSDVWRNNLPATMNVLEAARRRGVPRVVFASSNHVTGLYERDDPYARIVAGDYAGLDPQGLTRITTGAQPRPDGHYAIAKLAGEAAGRYVSECFGLSFVGLRIGTVNAEDRPRSPREYATLLTHRDLLHLVDCALRAPSALRYGIYYGVSANTWRFWEIDDARRDIGYAPRDDAERFRGQTAAST